MSRARLPAADVRSNRWNGCGRGAPAGPGHAANWDAELAAARSGRQRIAESIGRAGGSRSVPSFRAEEAVPEKSRSSGENSPKQMLDAAHGETVRTVVSIQWVDDGRIEVQVARVEIACGVGRGRPIVAVRADVRQGSRRSAVARSRQKRTIAGMNGRKKGSFRPDWDEKLTAQQAASGLLNLPTSLTQAVAPVIPGRRSCFHRISEKRMLTRVSKSLNDERACRCWTQRTEKALARLLLFSGFTAPELKFRLPALRLSAQ